MRSPRGGSLEERPDRNRYRVVPFPRHRLAVLDVLSVAARQYTVHGLLEVDVTAARERMRSMAPPPSLTSFVVATVARAVQGHPEVNARRAGRRLVLFDDVDVVVTVERPLDRTPVPMPYAVRGAGTKSCAAISAEIQAARDRAVSTAGDLAGTRAVTAMPSALRRLRARVAGRFPSAVARFGPPIGISSLGMFGHGGGWGIPLSPMTAMVTVGGIATRPVFEAGVLVERELLPLTLSFDHAVVDGAPAARFAETLRHLFETAAVLDESEGDGGQVSPPPVGL